MAASWLAGVADADEEKWAQAKKEVASIVSALAGQRLLDRPQLATPTDTACFLELIGIALARVNARFDLNFIGIVSEEDRGGRCQDLSNEMKIIVRKTIAEHDTVVINTSQLTFPTVSNGPVTPAYSEVNVRFPAVNLDGCVKTAAAAAVDEARDMTKFELLTTFVLGRTLLPGAVPTAAV
eukprot:scaffold14279_cov160-Skeletonema_menzelii.AAC.4